MLQFFSARCDNCVVTLAHGSDKNAVEVYIRMLPGATGNKGLPATPIEPKDINDILCHSIPAEDFLGDALTTALEHVIGQLAVAMQKGA